MTDQEIAAKAWNDTKADEDPEFDGVQNAHRLVLQDSVDIIRRTGYTGIAGLEKFEVAVKQLLEKEKAAAEAVAVVELKKTKSAGKEK